MDEMLYNTKNEKSIELAKKYKENLNEAIQKKNTRGQ